MPRYNPEKTEKLEQLRIDHMPKVTIVAMAKYFSMDREAVRAWELGESHPAPTRRARFISYLLDVLGLRSNLDNLHQLWNTIMVDEWGWDRLSNEELRNHLHDATDDHAIIPTVRVAGMSQEIDERYIDSFYHYRLGFATSIRLCGAADEFFPPSAVHIIPDTTPYALPDDLLLVREEIIERLKQRAGQRNAMFFDGPNTRLIDFRVTPRDQTEQKHLELRLGPISWYDYSVGKFALAQRLKKRTIDELRQYMDLDEIAYSRIIRNNQLGNILCTISTIVTSDGFALYLQRGTQVSAEPGRLTGVVAENIQQVFDRSLEKPLLNELPAPFRTVIRGVEEEASPRLADYLRQNPQSIFLLGLDFDLLSFQPDLLFMIYLPLSYEEIRYLCRQHPGKDFIEGNIQAVALTDTPHLDTILSSSKWIPGGKASFIRTLEFLDTNLRAYRGEIDFASVLRILLKLNK